jgi:hypothetical protein
VALVNICTLPKETQLHIESFLDHKNSLWIVNKGWYIQKKEWYLEETYNRLCVQVKRLPTIPGATLSQDQRIQYYRDKIFKIMGETVTYYAIPRDRELLEMAVIATAQIYETAPSVIDDRDRAFYLSINDNHCAGWHKMVLDLTGQNRLPNSKLSILISKDHEKSFALICEAMKTTKSIKALVIDTDNFDWGDDHFACIKDIFKVNKKLKELVLRQRSTYDEKDVSVANILKNCLVTIYGSKMTITRSSFFKKELSKLLEKTGFNKS